MRLQRSLTIGLISTCISIAAWIAAPDMALAQEASSVSMVTLQVVPGAQGQSVVTPKGMVVPLPGAGVSGGSVQVYMGSQGGFWYVDKNGQNVDLTGYVARMRSMAGGQAATQPVPQYAPAPEPVVINNQQTAPSSGSSGYGAAAMVGTAAAAGLGAMAGSAMSSGYYNNNYGYHGYYGNVPYGSPVHYPAAAGAKPYYVNASGNTVNVDRNYNATANVNNVNAANVNATKVNAAKVDENQFNNVHASNMEAQQKWYQNQQKANPQQFKSWQQQSASGENPFVNKDAQSRYGANAMAQGQAGRFGGAAEADGGGRFGRGGADGAGAAAAEGGGRFGRGAEGGGGRFGGGGGRFGGGEAAGGGLGGRRRGGR